MPIALHCGKDFPLTKAEAEELWKVTLRCRKFSDEMAAVRCVEKKEIHRLNKMYRSVSKPTNVLTFSYGEGSHDIALCLSVARQEAKERGASFKQYIALLLVHAFLHITGMDHEQSKEEAEKTRRAEKDILERVGFQSSSL